MFYEFPKLVFRKIIVSLYSLLSDLNSVAFHGYVLSDGIFSPLHFKLTGSKGSSDSDV